MAAWNGGAFPVTAPGRQYIRAAGSLGWAFPAALGAALGAPGRHVACVTGDGGLGYHLSELETALRCHIPILVVVLNNRSLAFEYHSQKYLHGNHVIPHVNDFVDVDYSAVARAFGVHGHRITDPRELPDRMREALHTDVPTLLDVIVDKEVYSPMSNILRLSSLCISHWQKYTKPVRLDRVVSELRRRPQHYPGHQWPHQPARPVCRTPRYRKFQGCSIRRSA